jgi:hypothetical protein
VDLTTARWHKSSYSNGSTSGNGCVEVAFLPDAQVALRDTKDRALAPHRFHATEWTAFLTAIRAGELAG